MGSRDSAPADRYNRKLKIHFRHEQSRPQSGVPDDRAARVLLAPPAMGLFQPRPYLDLPYNQKIVYGCLS